MALKQRHSTPGNYRLAVLPNGEPDAPPSSGATYLAHPLFQDQLFSALSPDLWGCGCTCHVSICVISLALGSYPWRFSKGSSESLSQMAETSLIQPSAQYSQKAKVCLLS